MPKPHSRLRLETRSPSDSVVPESLGGAGIGYCCWDSCCKHILLGNSVKSKPEVLDVGNAWPGMGKCLARCEELLPSHRFLTHSFKGRYILSFLVHIPALQTQTPNVSLSGITPQAPEAVRGSSSQPSAWMKWGSLTWHVFENCCFV